MPSQNISKGQEFNNSFVSYLLHHQPPKAMSNEDDWTIPVWDILDIRD